MENEASTMIDNVIRAEIATDEEITEKNDEAVRALEDLHAAIEKVYILRKGTREGLLQIDDFINGIKSKFGAVNVEGYGARKDSIIQLLGNISWSIRAVLDEIDAFNKDVAKQD